METEIRNMTTEEREKEGRTISNLNGKFIKKELKLAIAKFSSYKPIETEINVGDMVLISQGNPFDRNISGIVTEKKSHSILVGFFWKNSGLGVWYRFKNGFIC